MMQGKLHKQLDEESKMSVDNSGNSSPVNYGGEMLRLPNVASLKDTTAGVDHSTLQDGYSSPTSYLS